ncbi:MAG: UDP-2,3-diacylglucosamine diphosphatase, partial [Pseudomonadota bacterium]|nr:UDP-2,3-diacylglucosamine diphosphatase [Pseudomonadota bacterium]
LFDRFLNTDAPTADAVYILGDLFEAWIGDDDLNDFNLSIITKIRRCVDNGTPVFVMPGNRDFLMGDRFATLTGCTLLSDPYILKLYDKNILLMHGDTLCTHDKLHQYYRRVVQNPFIKRLSMILLPLTIRKRLGKGLRKLSKRHISRQSANTLDVINSSVLKKFQEFPAEILIHGHTHRPMIETTYIDLQPRIRYVLSAWHDSGTAIRINSDQTMQFISIT